MTPDEVVVLSDVTAALRAGQTLIFSQEPTAGEQPLPADLARGILQSERDNRIFERDGAFRLGDAKDNPDGMLATAVPEARAKLMLRMPQSELCEFRVTGGPGVFDVTGVGLEDLVLPAGQGRGDRLQRGVLDRGRERRELA